METNVSGTAGAAGTQNAAAGAAEDNYANTMHPAVVEYLVMHYTRTSWLFNCILSCFQTGHNVFSAMKLLIVLIQSWPFADHTAAVGLSGVAAGVGASIPFHPWNRVGLITYVEQLGIPVVDIAIQFLVQMKHQAHGDYLIPVIITPERYYLFNNPIPDTIIQSKILNANCMIIANQPAMTVPYKDIIEKGLNFLYNYVKTSKHLLFTKEQIAIIWEEFLVGARTRLEVKLVLNLVLDLIRRTQCCN